MAGEDDEGAICKYSTTTICLSLINLYSAGTEYLEPSDEYIQIHTCQTSLYAPVTGAIPRGVQQSNHYQPLLKPHK